MRKIAAVSLTMGKFIAGIVIAILASSVISVGVSTMLIAGPQGLEGPQGDTGVAGSIGLTGEKGDTGSSGPAGPQWPQGERGIGFEQRGNISVGYSAFVPQGAATNEVYYQPGWGLSHYYSSQHVVYIAPLQLPHGATITNVTLYFFDNDVSFFVFILRRENQTDFEEMGSVRNEPGSDTPGYTHISFSSIDYATVNNDNYHYYLNIGFPGSTSYRFYYALIEYKYPA